MGPVKPTGMAHRGNIRDTDSAAPGENRNVCDIHHTRSFLGLREIHPVGQVPPASTALGEAGAARGSFAGWVKPGYGVVFVSTEPVLEPLVATARSGFFVSIE